MCWSALVTSCAVCGMVAGNRGHTGAADEAKSSKAGGGEAGVARRP